MLDRTLDLLDNTFFTRIKSLLSKNIKIKYLTTYLLTKA